MCACTSANTIGRRTPPVELAVNACDLVDEISPAWGVVRDASGGMRVWCDLPLEPAGVPGRRSTRSEAEGV